MSAKRQHTCGNCAHFIRVKDWSGDRNGMCGKFDYNCHSDSRYARRCPGYKGTPHASSKAARQKPEREMAAEE